MGFLFSDMEVDISGIRYGNITALEFNKREKGRIYWKFKCGCGTIFFARKYKVTSGTLKSCGCYGKQRRKEGLQEYHKNNKRANRTDKKIFSNAKLQEILLKRAYKSYLKNAIKRKYAFDLSIEQFSEIVQQSCYYCKTKPSKELKYKSTSKLHKYDDVVIKINGVDRKNNNEGYILRNVVSCCTICNYAKRNLDYEVFMNWLKQIRSSK